MAGGNTGSSVPSSDGQKTSIFAYLGIDESVEKTGRTGKWHPADIENDLKEASLENGTVYADIVRAYSESELKYNILQVYRFVEQKGLPIVLLNDLDFSTLPEKIHPEAVLMITQDHFKTDDVEELAKVKHTLTGNLDKRLRGHLLLIGVTDKTYGRIFGSGAFKRVKEEPKIVQEQEHNVVAALGLLLIGVVPTLTVLLLLLPIDAGVFGFSSIIQGLMVSLTIAGAVLLVLGSLHSEKAMSFPIYVSLLVFTAVNIAIVFVAVTVFSTGNHPTLLTFAGINPPGIYSSSTATVFNSVIQVMVALVLFFLVYGFSTRTEKWIAAEAVIAIAIGMFVTAIAPMRTLYTYVAAIAQYPFYAFFSSNFIPYHPFLGLSAGQSIIFTSSYVYYVAALTLIIASNLLFSFVYLSVAFRIRR